MELPKFDESYDDAGVHVVKSFGQLNDVIMKMSAEAAWVQSKQRPLQVRFLLGDTHGCGGWRGLNVATANAFLTEAVKMHYTFDFDPRDQSLYRNYDLLILQRPVAQNFQPVFDAFKSERDKHNLPVITAFEIDDAISQGSVPKYNMASHLYNNVLGEKYLNEVINKYDCMIVSTEELKKQYSKVFPKDYIYVIPNFPPKYLWEFDDIRGDRLDDYSFKNPNGKPTILFAGGSNRFSIAGDTLHITDDLTQLEPIIRKTVDSINWIFMGASPLKIADLIESGKIEHVKWEGFLSYSRALHRLAKRCDLFVSPLIDNAFNRGKTNIKITETAAVGLPLICSDITPYDELPRYQKVMPGDTQGWLDRINEFIASPELRMKALQNQKKVLDEYWLEDNLKYYEITYKQIIKDVLCKRGLVRN